MRRVVILMSAVAVVMLAAGVLAQAKPSFAGKWTLVPDPNAPPAGGRGGGAFGGLGMNPVITQDAATLTLIRTTQAGEVKSAYNLDGTDSKNTMTFGENSVVQVSKVKWDGSKLIITTTADFGGNKFETSMSLSLDASGRLNVESTRPDFQGGGAPIVTKTAYVKS